MYIKCWGARGGIPVSGQEYNKYGGNTACLEVRDNKGTIIIIDAGTGIRQLGQALLLDEDFDLNIIFSHFHWDHIIGFPFFKPIYDLRYNLNILDHIHFEMGVKELLSEVMRDPFFPVSPNEIKANVDYKKVDWKFTVGEIILETIPVSHPNGGIGFKFIHENRTFVFLTDNELGYVHPGGRSFDDYVSFCKGADLLIHDAEYNENEYVYTEGWGHSTYSDAVRLALEAGVKSLGLFHHNQERNDIELDRLVADANFLITKAGGNLDCFAVSQEMELKLENV
jgi:phosphoribosyl 1,2-cyclic phosphodiesterase